MREPEPAAGLRARLATVVGPIGSLRPLSGTAYLVQSGGRALVAKLGPGAPDEADGLRLLAAVADAPPVPDVVFVEADLVVTTAVDQMPRTPAHDEALGRALARLHRAPSARWGGGSSWVGACPVVARLAEFLPPGRPALVHGDLWWGNVLFGTDRRSWLIDPSVHGGHPEEDLAMLALFGAVPDRLLAAYAEVRPLDAGWEDRIGLFQLPPQLVHAVLFGGGYGARAEAVARRYT